MRPIDHETVAKFAFWQNRIASRRQVESLRWFWAGPVASTAAGKAGVVAWYDCLRDAVVIPAQYRAICGDVTFAPTIAHEITHARQRSDLGLCGYLFMKAFARRNLENDAIREERRAERLLEVSVL